MQKLLFLLAFIPLLASGQRAYVYKKGSSIAYNAGKGPYMVHPSQIRVYANTSAGNPGTVSVALANGQGITVTPANFMKEDSTAWGTTAFAAVTNFAVATAIASATGAMSDALQSGSNTFYYSAANNRWQTAQGFRVVNGSGVQTFDISPAGVATGNGSGLTNLSPGNVIQSGDYRFASDSEKATWNAKEPSVTPGTTGQYYRGDKTWQTLNLAAVADAGTMASQNSNAINVSGGSITGVTLRTITVTATATTQTTLSNRAYISNNASARVLFSLPASPTVGDFVQVIGLGAGGFQINAGTGNFIRGNTSTTSGGNVQSGSQYDVVTLVYIAANNWSITSQRGTLTIN